jgi:hypothetical protein
VGGLDRRRQLRISTGPFYEMADPIIHGSAGENIMSDFYESATQSFQESLERVEKEGRKDSPEWYLAAGLLRLAQGLKEDQDAKEELQKGFARSWTPHN